MIKKIHHVGLAVESTDEVAGFFKKLFGVELEPDYALETKEFLSRMVKVGQNHFELLEPRGSNGLIERFIKARGQGIYHLALHVDEREAVLRQCHELSLNVLGGAFIHPKSAFGTLIELTEGVQKVDY